MIVRDNSSFLFEITELSWDSEIFGFKCGSLVISKKESEQMHDREGLTYLISQVINDAKLNDFRFLTLKIDAREIDIINLVFKNNGLLVDTELTYHKYRTTQNIRSVLPEGFSIQKIERYWDDYLFELTNILRYSRFFRDKNIDIKVAQRLWNNSIYNNCNGRATYSIVCFYNNKPVGLMNVFEVGEVSNIFLIAVLPVYQNKGLGSEMMNFYQGNLGTEIKKQTIETQVINYGAQNFYTRMGYEVLKSKYIVHLWL